MTLASKKHGLIRPPGPRLRRFLPLKFVENRQKGGRKSTYAELNITSMVDMLTILVIFLLQLFSTSGQIDVVKKHLNLPKVMHSKDLRESIVISVTKNLLNGEGEINLSQEREPIVTDVRKLMNDPNRVIEKLRLKLLEKVEAARNAGKIKDGQMGIVVAIDVKQTYDVFTRIQETCRAVRAATGVVFQVGMLTGELPKPPVAP